MFLTILLLSLISILLIIYIWFKKNFSFWSHHKQIPSVPGQIFSGNFTDFLTFKTNFSYHIKTIYDDPKFENEAVVGVYGLYKPALLIREPELIKSILIKDFDQFCNRSCESDIHHDPLGALTLFLAKYPYWRDIRTKLSPVFSSGKLKYMYPLILKVCDNLEEHLNEKGDKFVVELKELCGRFTTDIISSTLMGFNSNALNNPKEEMYKETVRMAAINISRGFDLMAIYFLPKLSGLLRPRMFSKKTEKFIRSSVSYAVAERERTGGNRNDLIDIFIKIKQEAKVNGEDVAQCMEGLISQGCMLMAGGFETSSTTLSNALLEVAKHKDVQKKLREEILAAFLEGNGQISYESLNKMEYVQMIMDETLRLYPVLPLIDRKYEQAANKTTPYSLKPYYDYNLPQDMPVYISSYSLHYDPKHWPNPKQFDPERFSVENKKFINPMTYLPFGDGPRNCIGARMGLLEFKIGLVYFLKNHYVQVCDRTVLQPEFERKAVVLQTVGGIHLEIVRDNLYDNAQKNK